MEQSNSGEEVDSIYESQFDDQEIGIQILGLHKQYRRWNRSKIVLNGLNLNCQSGKLYILYGSGKCGKSAVVKSILNIEPFSRGVIAILNKTCHSRGCGEIGYMPQKIGLDVCLTAYESINYFAILHRLNRHDTIQKFSAMQSPLTINEYSTLVKDLTVDQRRVLSFYIAIMTSPKIVVLDQPMLGCDPLYKRFFWQKLRFMVDNEKTTILMTCCDEVDVKYADTVGYLRNGQIIIEESPADLMKRYNIWNFNDLILSISVAELNQFEVVDSEKTKRKDTASIKSGGFDITHFTWNDDSESAINSKIKFGGSFCDTPDKKDWHVFNLGHFFQQLSVLISWQAAVSRRNYRKLVSHLLLPALCVLFYGFSVGHEMNEINLGIVYCGNDSQQTDKMDTPSISALDKRISSNYLTKKAYDDYDAAVRDADRGVLSAVLLLNTPSNESVGNYEKFGCQTDAFNKTNVVLELYSSSKLVRSHIIDQLSRAYGGSQEHPLMRIATYSLSRPEKNDEKCLTECPITPFVSIFNYQSSGKNESEVMYLIWGAVSTVSHFSGALLGSLPLCTQNLNGLMDRMKTIEITNFKLQIVHWLTRSIYILGQTFLLLVSSAAFLKAKFTAYGIFSSWCAILLQSLCGFSFGILLFAMLKKQVPIMLYLIVLELIISSLSGFFWNYHGLTPLFQKLTIVLPHHSVSKLLFQVVIEENLVTENNIWVGFISPLFWMISTVIIYCVYNQSNQ
ncbi:ABC transporter G family member 23-like [Bradysia coprophila]|uniref:ABC transporter G family member 23-like n=1 Tax=Bradysia coprophila TaxID=38358 RepID=UPI00187D845E|nr:ABC transporter G family member 23-like [Bradysia coprophila]